jgi:putative Ca2+/H+ antiporter (TMEM165/GDT1 family)
VIHGTPRDATVPYAWSINLAIAAAVFPIIFVAELPDKTMFASLLMGTRGRPSAVWVGAALAFTVHVAIAVTVSATLYAVLPHRLVEAIVAVLFLGGAIFAFRDSMATESAAGERATRIGDARRTVAAAFVVIFLAEWGDLTQIVTATLAAHYHAPFEVAVGSGLALWAVAAVAVGAGQLLERSPMASVRRLTGVVLIVLAALAAYEAASGGGGPF